MSWKRLLLTNKDSLPLLTSLWYFSLETLETIAELRAPIYQKQISFPHGVISETNSVTPNQFISFLEQVNHYLSAVEVLKKIYRVKNFCANVLN